MKIQGGLIYKTVNVNNLLLVPESMEILTKIAIFLYETNTVHVLQQ